MRGKCRGAALGAALMAAALIAAPAHADTKYGSKVTIANSFPAFHGKVKSKSDVCIERRRVKLFSQKPGKDTLLGRTRTNARGRWKIKQDPPSGVFYAKLKKGGSASLGIKCGGDTSKPVVID
jgi:hypothetical protein